MNKHALIEGSNPISDNIKTMQVLLVDDDDFSLDLLEFILKDLGVISVIRALDGQSALTIIDTYFPAIQLVICDLTMPGMDGIMFLRHLADRSFKGGVIIASGSDERVLNTVKNLISAHSLHFIGALEKPVTQTAMIEALKLMESPKKRVFTNNQLTMLLPEELAAGLQSNCIETYFQPKIALRDRRMIGVECLVRWRHPERGLVFPDAFISVAEQHGLIDQLTLAVFTNAVKVCRAWNKQGHHLKMAINLSMSNMGQMDLPDVLAEIAFQNGVEPQQIMLELTESNLMEDITASLEIITRFRIKGFGLSIDDFGTGYSSIEKLKLLPFTELKIDRSFVSGISANSAAYSILESSVRMGQALGMSVVAEGVETQEDLDLVTAAGCNEVQGYFYSKAIQAEDCIVWKKHWENNNRSFKMKIVLIVDDSATSRMLFKAHMPKDSGYEVREAKDMSTALQVAEESSPVLVVLDYNMPDHNGVEVAQKLLAMGLKAKLVLLTANTQQAIIEEAMKAGFFKVLEKPITHEMLAVLIEETLL